MALWHEDERRGKHFSTRLKWWWLMMDLIREDELCLYDHEFVIWSCCCDNARLFPVWLIFPSLSLHTFFSSSSSYSFTWQMHASKLHHSPSMAREFAKKKVSHFILHHENSWKNPGRRDDLISRKLSYCHNIIPLNLACIHIHCI